MEEFCEERKVSKNRETEVLRKEKHIHAEETALRKLEGWTVRNEKIRYLFFGVCTTLVNLGVFIGLRYVLAIGRNSANVISILTAVLFAFWVNRRFVFRSRRTGAGQIAAEFAGFAGLRAASMLIEFGGVMALTEVLKLSDLASKGFIQFIVIIFNYLISKFVVFREGAV